MSFSLPFDTLHGAYQDRLAAAYAAHKCGRRVVGYVGNTVPVEALIAARCFAVRVAPIEGDTSLADRYVESFADLDARLIFAQYCGGALDFLDLLVVPRSSETQHKLYLALREANRIGLTRTGPALWLYDILHTQRESSRLYGLARTHDLIKRLSEIGGQVPDDSGLRHAIALTNETRRLQQQLQERRVTRAISGWQAQVANGAVRFMAPAHANESLRAWLDADTHTPSDGPRLLVKGVPLDHAELHALVEQASGGIVLEDDEWGARAGAPLIGTEQPPLEAIFDHYWRDVPCTRIHPAQAQGPWLTQMLEHSRLDGVLFYLPRPDDIYGWSFPADRDSVEQAGLPWLLIRDDARNSAQRSSLTTALATFIAQLDAAAP